MFCKSCGKEISNDSIYCSFCGAKQGNCANNTTYSQNFTNENWSFSEQRFDLNNSIQPVEISNKKQLENALDLQIKVISLKGKLLDEIYKQIEGALKKRRTDHKLSIAGFLLALGSILTFQWWGILAGSVLNVVNLMSLDEKYLEEFKNYNMSFFIDQNGKKTLLLFLTNSFRCDIDVIRGYENYYFISGISKTVVCKCGNKLSGRNYNEKFHRLLCPKCGRIIVSRISLDK